MMAVNFLHHRRQCDKLEVLLAESLRVAKRSLASDPGGVPVRFVGQQAFKSAS
jgi:hypothetical protein